MKRIAAVAVVLGLAAAPAVFAEQTKMSEAQLDNVTAGLADVAVNIDNAGNANVTVSPSVQASPNANVTVSVLGGGAPAGL
jgi:hypothetical protein